MDFDLTTFIVGFLLGGLVSSIWLIIISGGYADAKEGEE